MKTGILVMAVCAIVLTGFTAPVIADELGAKLAKVLCHWDTSYKLSPQEEALWKNAHSGNHSSATPGVVYTFSKSAGTDSGKCTWRRAVPPKIASARVTKSGSTLSRTGYAQGAMIE